MIQKLKYKECKECIDYNGNINKCFNICGKPLDAIEELAEYKQLEEQGLLLKLPCEVGDTVWVIDEYENEYDGYLFMATCGECVIVAVEYAHCTGDFNRQLLEMIDESYDNFGVDVEIYHKDKVFLTKEEAEQELKRLECAE